MIHHRVYCESYFIVLSSNHFKLIYKHLVVYYNSYTVQGNTPENNKILISEIIVFTTFTVTMGSLKLFC